MEKKLKGSKADEIFLSQKNAYSDLMNKDHIYNNDYLNIDVYTKWRNLTVDRDEKKIWDGRMIHMALNMDSNSMDKSIRNLIRKGVPDALKHLIWMRSNYVNYFVISFPKFYETTLYNTFGDKIPDDFSNDCPTFCGGILGLQEDIMCVQTKIEEIEIDNNMEGDNFNINDSTSNILQLLFNTPNEVKKDSDKYLLPEHNFWIEPKTLSSPNFYFASSAINPKKKKKFFYIENVKNKILKSKKLDNYLRVSSDSILPCSNNFDGRNGKEMGQDEKNERKNTEESKVRKKSKEKKKGKIEETEDKVRVIRNHMDTVYSMEIDKKNDKLGNTRDHTLQKIDANSINNRNTEKERNEYINRYKIDNINREVINERGKENNKIIGNFKVVDSHNAEKNIFIKDDIISFHEISNKQGKGANEENDYKSFHIEKDNNYYKNTNANVVDTTNNTSGILDSDKYLHIQYYMNEQYRISKKQAEKMFKAKLYLRNKRKKRIMKYNREKGGSLNLDNGKINENEEEEEGQMYSPFKNYDSINSNEKLENDENECFEEGKHVSFHKTKSFFKKKFQSRNSFLKRNERNLSDHITLLLNENAILDSEDNENLNNSSLQKKKDNTYLPDTKRRVASMIEMSKNERQMQKKEEFRLKEKKKKDSCEIGETGMENDIKALERDVEPISKEQDNIFTNTLNSNGLKNFNFYSTCSNESEIYSLKKTKGEKKCEKEINKNEDLNKKKNKNKEQSGGSTTKSLFKRIKNMFYKKNKKDTTKDCTEENEKKEKQEKVQACTEMHINNGKYCSKCEQNNVTSDGKPTKELINKSYGFLDGSYAIRNQNINFSDNKRIMNKKIKNGMTEKTAFRNDNETNSDHSLKSANIENEIENGEVTLEEQIKYNIVVHYYSNKNKSNSCMLNLENNKREKDAVATHKEINKNINRMLYKKKKKKSKLSENSDSSIYNKLENNKETYDVNYKDKTHIESLENCINNNSNDKEENENNVFNNKNSFLLENEMLYNPRSEEEYSQNKNKEKGKNNLLNINQNYLEEVNSQEDTSYQFDYGNSFDNDLENFHLPSRELKGEETTNKQQQKYNFKELTEKKEYKNFDEDEEAEDYENTEYKETEVKIESDEKENKELETVDTRGLEKIRKGYIENPNSFDNAKDGKQFENELYHKFYEKYETGKSYPNVYNLDDATELTALLNDEGKHEIKKLLWAINSNFGNDVEFAPIIPNLCIILLIYFNASVVYCIVHCLIQKGIDSVKNKETPFFVFKRKDFVKYIKYILNSFIRFLPKCYYYLRKLNFDLAAWTARCIQDGFSRMLPFDFVLRIYGAFLFEGQKILCLYCLALLKFLENDILKCTNIEEVENILYHICMNPYLDINELTQMAYKFKLKHKVKHLKFSTKCPSPYLMNVKIKTFYRPRLNDTSVIISSVHWENLWAKIPSNVRALDPILTYCSQTDGYSLKRLLDKSEKYKRKPMILIVETINSDLIGFFCPFSLNTDISFFKDADKSTAFVYSFISTFRCYRWSGKNSMLIMISDGIYIGGNDVAIYMDKDIKYGRTSKSESFMSPPLISEGRDFQIKDVEIWHLK